MHDTLSKLLSPMVVFIRLCTLAVRFIVQFVVYVMRTAAALARICAKIFVQHIGHVAYLRDLATAVVAFVILYVSLAMYSGKPESIQEFIQVPVDIFTGTSSLTSYSALMFTVVAMHFVFVGLLLVLCALFRSSYQSIFPIVSGIFLAEIVGSAILALTSWVLTEWIASGSSNWIRAVAFELSGFQNFGPITLVVLAVFAAIILYRVGQDSFAEMSGKRREQGEATARPEL